MVERVISNLGPSQNIWTLPFLLLDHLEHPKNTMYVNLPVRKKNNLQFDTLEFCLGKHIKRVKCWKDFCFLWYSTRQEIYRAIASMGVKITFQIEMPGFDEISWGQFLTFGQGFRNWQTLIWNQFATWNKIEKGVSKVCYLVQLIRTSKTRKSMSPINCLA